jgi:hypothetical protein
MEKLDEQGKPILDKDGKPLTEEKTVQIPAFKVGGTWRLRQSEIDQCINDQTRAGAKKEVMRKREQQKSSEQPVSPGRTARRSRQRA